jgi:hypothetical protein
MVIVNGNVVLMQCLRFTMARLSFFQIRQIGGSSLGSLAMAQLDRLAPQDRQAHREHQDRPDLLDHQDQPLSFSPAKIRTLARFLSECLLPVIRQALASLLPITRRQLARSWAWLRLARQLDSLKRFRFKVCSV